jgi:hypothetical protein
MGLRNQMTVHVSQCQMASDDPKSMTDQILKIRDNKQWHLHAPAGA